MTISRIGFVLCSSAAQPIPSTRVAVINMLPFLQAAGMRPCILFAPPCPNETPDLAGIASQAVATGCQVVVLQKVHGPSALALGRELASFGIRTVYVACDWINTPMVEATNATVVVTDYLRSLCPSMLLSRVNVVHDGIERPEACKNDWGTGTPADSNRPLRAVLVTSTNLDKLPVLGKPPAGINIRIIGRYSRGLQRLREIRWTLAKQQTNDRLNYLRFLANQAIKCVPWDSDGVYREMREADIGVIPIETPLPEAGVAVPPAWMLKSENRLTLKMSMGLPVIATPIPSYEPVITHGVNGFFARSTRDWETCFSELRDPDRRREMGLAARASVAKIYSMEEQASKLVAVLQKSGI